MCLVLGAAGDDGKDEESVVLFERVVQHVCSNGPFLKRIESVATDVRKCTAMDDKERRVDRRSTLRATPIKTPGRRGRISRTNDGGDDSPTTNPSRTDDDDLDEKSKRLCEARRGTMVICGPSHLKQGCGQTFSSCFCTMCLECSDLIAVMGKRRHHCRRCGAPLCDKCWIRKADDGRIRVCRSMSSCRRRVLARLRDAHAETKSALSSRFVEKHRSSLTPSPIRGYRKRTSNPLSTEEEEQYATTTTHDASLCEDEHYDHVSRVSIIQDDDVGASKPTRTQIMLASRLARWVGTSSETLVRDLTQCEGKEIFRETMRKMSSSSSSKTLSNDAESSSPLHLRGVSILQDIGCEKEANEKRRQSPPSLSTTRAPSASIAYSRTPSRMDATLTRRLSWGEDFSESLYDASFMTPPRSERSDDRTKVEDEEDAASIVVVQSPSTPSCAPDDIHDEVPALQLYASVVEETDSDSSDDSRRGDSPTRVRGASIFDDIE